jgi:hypothetical protein
MLSFIAYEQQADRIRNELYALRVILCRCHQFGQNVLHGFYELLPIEKK